MHRVTIWRPHQLHASVRARPSGVSFVQATTNPITVVVRMDRVLTVLIALTLSCRTAGYYFLVNVSSQISGFCFACFVPNQTFRTVSWFLLIRTLP
jgi:hypothetical protein